MSISCDGKHLLHKPLLFYDSVSSASLAGFHLDLDCTSNSLGATSLGPVGLPQAIEYQMLCPALANIVDTS